jgi:DNA-binding transcriptional LysR family regulator
MELRHLRYFAVLAEELHFGRAAARLSITQPPLSFNIKQLEEELGVQLFYRDNKRVTLTQAGEALQREATNVLNHAQRAAALARSIGGGGAGRLDVGFSSSMLYMDLAGLLERFRRSAPDIEIGLHELGLPEQLDALVQGRLDAGFVDSVALPEGFAGKLLFREPYVCCVAVSHRLSQAAAIELSELADEPFIYFRREGSPVSYDQVMRMCGEAGFAPRIVHAVRHWLTIVAMVGENAGVALVPARMARTQIPKARFVPLVTTTPAMSSGYLLWRPERTEPALRSFAKFVEETIPAVSVDANTPPP